jgi:phage terminase large subunit-like protein
MWPGGSGFRRCGARAAQWTAWAETLRGDAEAKRAFGDREYDMVAGRMGDDQLLRGEVNDAQRDNMPNGVDPFQWIATRPRPRPAARRPMLRWREGLRDASRG